MSYWQSTFQHSQKFEFYRPFETDHTTTDYLVLTRGIAGRRALLVKLRMRNHKLMMKMGKNNQTTKDNRHYSFCGSSLIEDEVHFLFRCPTYSMTRNNVFNEVHSDSKYYPVIYKSFDQRTDELP